MSKVNNKNENNVDLFSAISLGDLILQNRIIMAPLTRRRASVGNVPGDMNAEYYRQRASAGLIISEATQISPQGVGYPNTPGIHSAEQIAGWQKVTNAVHSEGGLIFMQLWHVGRISHPDLQPNGVLPVAPSAVKPAGQAVTYNGLKDYVTPRALEQEEIPGIINDYKVAAKNALEAGFDGIELHSANGYLLDQFLRDGTNKRTDGYGGTIKNRSRLTLEVLEAVLEVWPAQKVGIRLSPGGTFSDMSDSNTRETFDYVIYKLNDYQLAYLHIREPDANDLRHGGEEIPIDHFRSIYDGILMVNGDYDKKDSNKVIKNNIADLVAYGKPFIANPDLPERLRLGAPLNEQDFDTFYGGGEYGYLDYPTLPKMI